MSDFVQSRIAAIREVVIYHNRNAEDIAKDAAKELLGLWNNNIRDNLFHQVVETNDEIDTALEALARYLAGEANSKAADDLAAMLNTLPPIAVWTVTQMEDLYVQVFRRDLDIETSMIHVLRDENPNEEFRPHRVAELLDNSLFQEFRSRMYPVAELFRVRSFLEDVRYDEYRIPGDDYIEASRRGHAYGRNRVVQDEPQPPSYESAGDIPF